MQRFPRLRKVRPEEAGILTALALRSKASNGYDADFMAQCVAEMTITGRDIESRPFELAIAADATIVGFFGLHLIETAAEVDPLYIEPRFKRTGIGRLLWSRLETMARGLGATSLVLDSDPFAVPFYRAMGCRVVGESPSGSIPGRLLPRLEKRLD